MTPEAWWTCLTAFGAHDNISEHILEHEKAIATEEIRQEWMRRLRPMPHRQNPPAKKGKGTQKELALLYHTVSAGETMFQGNEPSITRELSCLV
jgi:hypothetical protein